MHDYRIVGPYADLAVAATERHVSTCYQELGFRLFILQSRPYGISDAGDTSAIR